jgi:hypothetical protein
MLRLRKIVLVTLLVMGIDAIIATVIVCALYRLKHALAPEKIVWRFDQGDTINSVNWPSDLSGSDYDRTGQFDLIIIDVHGKTLFHDQVFHFYCQRKGNHVEWVVLHFGLTQTAAAAYVKAKDLMKFWPFRPENFDDLEAWHEGLAKHMSPGQFFLANKDRSKGGLAFDYPNFTLVAGGNVLMRGSITGGDPRMDGLDCNCVLTLDF